MKTKHILTALALPALFAACTADEFEGVNALQQAERAKLSKDFVLVTDGGVESRYAFDGTESKFVFEEGDLIGANIIDNYDPNATGFDKEDPTTWPIIYSVNPALPFKNVGQHQWKSDSELGVGNYLFTYPYSKKDNNRGAAKFELPRVMKYDSKNPYAAIEENNKAVAAVVLKAGETEAKADLKNLYAYPTVRVNFDNGDDVTKVTKVVLYSPTGFMYKGGIDNVKVARMFNKEVIQDEIDLSEIDAIEDEKTYWESKQTIDFIIEETIVADDAATVTPADYADIDKTPYLVTEMDEAVKTYANTNNKGVEVKLMLPSMADFETSDIIMYVVTDNGTYELKFKAGTNSDLVFSDKTPDELIKAALSRSTGYTLKTKNLSYHVDYAKSASLDNIVTTAEDWNKLVAEYGNASKFNGQGSNQTLKVSVLSDEFALTSDLKMPKVAVFEIATEVSVEGAVTLSNVKAATVNVKDGATLTTSKTFEATTVNVEAGGELKFAQVLNSDKEVVAYTKVTEVNNEGTVTVLAGAEATFVLQNKNKESELVVEAAASRAAGDAIANITGDNFGMILNNGIINAGTFENHAPSADWGYKYDNKTGWDARPTITNKGTFNAVGVVQNLADGVFKNEGVLSSNHNSPADFANLGTLKIAKSASTFIDSNEDGTIELSELTPANFTIFDANTADKYSADERGTIKYTVTGKGTTVDLTGSPVNYLIAESGIKLTKSYNYTATGATAATYVALPKLVLTKGGNVEIAPSTETTTPAVVTSMVIKAGEVTVVNHINSVGEILIAKDAKLIVPASAKLTIAAYTDIKKYSDTSKGTAQVNGTLVVTGATGDASGNLTAADITNEMITLGKEAVAYAGNKDNSAATTLQGKYDTAVASWWNDITTNTGWIPQYYNYNPYDVNVFAELLWGWYHNGSAVQKNMANALFVEFGFINASNVEQTAWTNLADDPAKEKKAIAAKLTDNTNFTAAIASKVLTLKDETGNTALTDLKEEFIVKNAKEVNVIDGYNLTNIDILYASEDAAMTEYYKTLAKPTTVTGESVAKYVNIWQFTSDIKTAFKNSTDSKYQYVWVNCDLHKVMQVLNDYSAKEWGTMLGLTDLDSDNKITTIATVKMVLKAASMSSSTATPVVNLKALGYYPASADWKYNDAQVVACQAPTAAN